LKELKQLEQANKGLKGGSLKVTHEEMRRQVSSEKIEDDEKEVN
jgi:hypothetical protein